MVEQDNDEDSIIPTSVMGEWNSLLMIDPDKFQVEWYNDKVTAYLCIRISPENVRKWKYLAETQCKKIMGIEYVALLEHIKNSSPGESAGVIHMSLISRIAKIQVLVKLISFAVVFHKDRPQIINFLRGKLAEVKMGFEQVDPQNLTFHHL